MLICRSSRQETGYTRNFDFNRSTPSQERRTHETSDHHHHGSYDFRSRLFRSAGFADVG